MISCCKECKNRRVTENYNCHDHCERYLAESMAHEQAKQKVRAEKDKEKQVTAALIDGYKRKRGKK